MSGCWNRKLDILLDVLVPQSLIFSRIAIGLVFAVSILGKLRDFPTFEQTVENFRILPQALVKVCAYIFLGGEIAVIGVMVLGNKPLLFAGFLMAILLLAIFCFAILTSLIRSLQVPCNCFGSSQRPASLVDVWRNIVFLACAFVGLTSLLAPPDATVKISLAETGLVGMMAVVFVVLSIYLGEVIEMFHFS